MSVDNGSQVDLSRTDLGLQLGSDPDSQSAWHLIPSDPTGETYSGGLAGSMMTDFLVGSSVTR